MDFANATKDRKDFIHPSQKASPESSSIKNQMQVDGNHTNGQQ